MTVCLLKILPEKGDLPGNFEKLLTVLEDIKTPGIDLFITPECFLDGYVNTEKSIDRKNLSQYGIRDKNDPYLTRIADESRKRNSWFIFGCVHNTPDGPKNAAFIFNREGQVAGIYYKVHLQTHNKKFVPGADLPVFTADFGTFGVMICADRRWPETVRTLALKGAQIIFNPTYGMHDIKNECMMKTRSYESEIFICFCHPLESLITNPLGDVEAHLVSGRDGFLIHDIDLTDVTRARESESGHLKDRVPEIYA